MARGLRFPGLGRNNVTASPHELGGTIFLADQLLSSAEGHHLLYNRALAAAARAAGWDAVVFGRKGMDPGLLDPFESRAVFRRDWRARPPAWARSNWRLLRVLDRLSGRRFYQDLLGAFRARPPRERDLVFAQMITPRSLAAWARWFLSVAEPPRLALHVAYDPSRYGSHAGFVSEWTKLRRSPRFARVSALTDSARLVAPYEELLGLKVRAVPHVVGEKVAATPYPAGPDPVFGVLGSPRRDKGFSEAVQAILAISADPSPPEFIVHVARPDEASKPWVEKLRSAKLANVRLVEHCMRGEDEYADVFGRATAFLLPYHLDVYGARTSGIFCEALATGRLAIVSEGSWMSANAGPGACLRTEERNAADLVTAIRDARARYAELLAVARAAAPGFRREFSGAGFISRMLAAAGEGAR